MEPEGSLLLARIADGDVEAFELFVWRYETDLRSFCRRHADAWGEEEDLLQEVLVKIWRRAGSFHRRSSVRTWLYRIVANTAIDEHRRRGRVPSPAGLEPGRAAESPWEVEERLDDQAAVRELLAGLAPTTAGSCCSATDTD